MLTVTFTFLLYGCLDNDDVPESPCYPYYYTYSNSGSAYNYESYTYNKENKLISTSGSNSTTTNSFDNKGKISKRSFSSGNYTLYAYDANGRMSTLTSYNSSNVITSKIEYTYNSSNQVTQRQTYTLISGVLTKSTYNTYEYASTKNRNYSKRLNYSSTGVLQSSETFQYDTKMNPQNVLYPDFPLYTTNNATQQIITPAGGTAITYTFIYAYSSKGFPLTYSVSGTNGYRETNEYQYNNCTR